MFDRSARATWRVGATPYVDIALLTALATLLQDVTSVSGAPSQLRDSSAALGSHDANRGDVHAAPTRGCVLSSEPVERRLTAILDVAGYSRLIGADEEGTLAQLK